jgi:hypothetical protein
MQCKDRLSSLSIDILQGIMSEIFSIVGNINKKDRFNEHISSNNSCKRSCLIEGAIELKDEAMRRQY